MTDEEIDRRELERERAEDETIEDEARPGGLLRDTEKEEPYDDATAALLINESRYAEYLERESRYYPYFHPETAPDSGAWQARRDGADAEREAGQ